MLLEKEKKQKEDYELAQFRLMSAILSNTATDRFHFGSIEFY